jgi:hypothetical protein
MSMNLGADISLLLPFGVSAQRSAAPLPVGETGGSKGKGGGQGGGSPGLHKRQRGRPGIPWPARGRTRDPFRARVAEPLRSDKPEKVNESEKREPRQDALCVQSLTACGARPRKNESKLLHGPGKSKINGEAERQARSRREAALRCRQGLHPLPGSPGQARMSHPPRISHFQKGKSPTTRAGRSSIP